MQVDRSEHMVGILPSFYFAWQKIKRFPRICDLNNNILMKLSQ